MGLKLLFKSHNHYSHFLFNIKEYDVKFFRASCETVISSNKNWCTIIKKLIHRNNACASLNT